MSKNYQSRRRFLQSLSGLAVSMLFLESCSDEPSCTFTSRTYRTSLFALIPTALETRDFTATFPCLLYPNSMLMSSYTSSFLPAATHNLREKFASKAILKTSQQLQAEATRVRGNAINSIKAQKLFFGSRSEEALRAFERLNEQALNFEQEAVQKSP